MALSENVGYTVYPKYGHLSYCLDVLFECGWTRGLEGTSLEWKIPGKPRCYTLVDDGLCRLVTAFLALDAGMSYTAERNVQIFFCRASKVENEPSSIPSRWPCEGSTATIADWWLLSKDLYKIMQGPLRILERMSPGSRLLRATANQGAWGYIDKKYIYIYMCVCHMCFTMFLHCFAPHTHRYTCYSLT
jgi:hypothetical protein